MSIAEAADAFEVADGFRIELVAAEPIVVDPVAMAFDEAGRLYVVEMRDYSELDKAHLGRVRLLFDDDRDGRFERSTIFAEGLSWPTAITCYDGGVFVGAAPDIYYFKDTNGDGIADQQQVVLTGFGRSNVQGLMNGFQWGIDNAIHGSTSSSGASVTRPGSTSPAVELRGRDFSFDPKTLVVTPETGGGQHGLSFNRWGDKFVCSNSDHLQAIVFDDRYLARNPLQSVSGARRSIAADGPQAPVFRSSPVEQWRTARTRMRVAGLAPGPIEGGGTAAGYFTSATGVTIYEGDLWPQEYRGWALIADVGSNLIHRKQMIPDGVTYRGQRVDNATEFVRSRDIWFRPVQMTIGPEGALYVADMYREVIEHPASLPAELKSQLDLNSGNDRGRIYRVVPSDYQYSAPASLQDASLTDLVDSLESENIWRRLTASRLLYERQDPSCVPLLRTLLSQAKSPVGRLAALYALAGQRALTDDDLIRGLVDEHPQVRRHALRLSEPRLVDSAALRKSVLALGDDSSEIVQFQLALTAGELPRDDAARVLANLLIRHADRPDIVSAAFTSMSSNAGLVLKQLLANSEWSRSAQASNILELIVGQIMRRNDSQELAVVVGALEAALREGADGTGASLVRVLSRLPGRKADSNNAEVLTRIEQLRGALASKLVASAESILDDPGAAQEKRLQAIATLGLDAFKPHRERLDALLEPRESPEIHSAVLSACGEYTSPDVADLILSHWESFGPQLRPQAVYTLLRREAWTLALLAKLNEEQSSLAALEPGQLATLQNYPSPKVKERLQALQGNTSGGDRQNIFSEYQPAAATKGDATRGAAIFRQHCAVCHELDSTGHAVGPNLASMVNRGAESILYNILVPNGEVDPRYVDYVVVTTDGEVLTGLVAGETSTSVSLRGQEGTTRTVLRVDIDELRSTGKSLMPEGFERVIDKSAMADLLTYLMNHASVGEPTK